MNYYLKNFKNLFSDDKKVIYQALMEKKDWINNVFYTDYSFSMTLKDGKEEYQELFSILNNSLLLKSDKNSDFSYRYFNQDKKYVQKEGHFLVAIDFTKLDEKSYKELFANFFRCISENEKVSFNDQIQDELVDIMVSEDDYVLILDNANLINHCYPLSLFKEIIYDKNYIDDLKLEALKEIASSFEIEVKELKDE